MFAAVPVRVSVPVPLPPDGDAAAAACRQRAGRGGEGQRHVRTARIHVGEIGGREIQVAGRVLDEADRGGAGRRSSGRRWWRRRRTVCVEAVLAVVPSFAAKEIVRLPVVGVSDVLLKVTARSAFWNCATVAVAPDEVSVSTPAPAL